LSHLSLEHVSEQTTRKSERCSLAFTRSLSRWSRFREDNAPRGYFLLLSYSYSEFQWVIDRLLEKKFPIVIQMAESLIQAWDTGESAMTVYGLRRRTTEREAVVLEGPHEDFSLEDDEL